MRINSRSFGSAPPFHRNRVCLAMNPTQSILATFAYLAWVAPAWAETESYPRISGEVLVEIQNDWTYDSDDRDAELNDLFTTTEPVLIGHLVPGLSILVHGVLEPIEDPEARDDRAFDDHGFFIEDFYLQYESDFFSLKGGKFTPEFGLAWDLAPGVYGTDFAEDTYEFSERIGIGGSLTLRSDHLGEHVISASTFFLDTSFLAHSLLDGRDEVNRSDGGVSNTEDFSSFALAVHGQIPALPNFHYHIGAIHQEDGRGDETGEGGFVVAGEFTAEIQELSAVPFVEYVYFDDADGVAGATRDLLTTSLALYWRGWNLALSRTGRDTNLPDEAETDDELFQVSAGYEFEFGLTLDAGWRVAEEEDIDSEILGILATYTLAF